MEKKKFLSTVLSCLILLGFVVVAVASSGSKSDIRDGVNGFIDGWEASGARGSVDLPDSLVVNGTNDLALN